MTYQPQPLTPTDAAQAVHTGDLIPWREAADLVGIPHRNVTRWIDRGKLPVITVNRRRLVNVVDVANLEHATRHRRRTTPR